MKKLIKKIRNRKQPEPQSTRITSDTIAEHRERVLAGGRRFKYPIQYTKHKLVINTIIIAVSAILLAIAVGWWQLYQQQNTSQFIYRVTKVVPVPVASVDGQPVLYSDYLMAYRSSVHYLENKEQVNLKHENAKRQLDYIKQQSMQGAIEDAFAAKLAKKMDISVSDKELNDFIKQDRQSVSGEVSEQTYYAVILDYYNWNPEEYRYVTKKKLLRQKVAYAMGKESLKIAGDVHEALKVDPVADLKSLSDKLSGQTGSKLITGKSGWVPKTNQDGGIAMVASKLEKSAISGVTKSTKGDGYYIIRLLDINDSQVSYEYINVPLTEFDKELKSITDNNKINKYIRIPEEK